MVNDPISDMLTRIKNGYMAKRSTVEIPYTKVVGVIAQVLVDNKYLSSMEVVGDLKKTLTVTLRYDAKEPAITEIRRISKPSLRVYAGNKKLPKVLGGLGKALISTPKGVMTDHQARKANLGGEVICEVW